eukprot:4857388-Amphidinium_carterae.1
MTRRVYLPGMHPGRTGGWPVQFQTACEHWGVDASVYHCSRSRGARRRPWAALQEPLREAPATTVGVTLCCSGRTVRQMVLCRTLGWFLTSSANTSSL